MAARLSVRTGQRQSPQCSCDESLGKTVAGPVCHLTRRKAPGGVILRSQGNTCRSPSVPLQGLISEACPCRTSMDTAVSTRTDQLPPSRPFQFETCNDS